MTGNGPASVEGPPEARRRARARAEWTVLAVVLLALATLVVLDLRSSRQAIEATERDRLEHNARSVEQRLSNRLEAASNGLAAIRDELPGLLRQPDGLARLDERLGVMAASMTGVRTLLVVDGNGRAIASNRKELVGGDWREGERYRTIRGRPDAALVYLSAPFLTPLGNWTISVGRAVLDRQGAFDGYVLAILDPEFFGSLLESARYAPDMVAALVHGSGTVVYRIPGPGGAARTDRSEVVGAPFDEHVASSRGLTFRTGPATSTGRESTFALQTVRPATSPSDGFLVAFLARGTDVILAAWRKDVRQRGALLALTVLAGAAGLYAVQRRRRAMDRLEAAHEAELRRQSEALRESEARLRLALDAARAGMWEWDVRNGRNEWSDAVWDLYGLDRSRAAASYEAWRDAIAPEDRDRTVQAVARAAGSGAEFEIEYRVGGGDREPRWLLARGRPVRGSGGDVERYTGIVVDITELKRGAELREENARLGALEAAVASLPIGVAITELDADGEPWLVAANAAQQSIMGSRAAPRTHVSSLPVRAFLPDRVTPVAPREGPGPRAARTGAPAPLCELHLRLADGAWRTVLATAVPIVSASAGAPRRAITLIVDVTAEREATKALRESEARYRDLVELSPDAVFVNRDGRIEFVNRAALALFGADRPGQLIGKSPFDLFHPDFHALVRERLALLKTGVIAPPVLERIVRLDGAPRDVEVTGAAFHDARGMAIQAVLRDVTDERRREAALRESEQRYRAIFEGATDGIVTADPATGRLLSCNAAFAAMTGYTEEEIRVLRYEDLHEPRVLEQVGQAFDAMAAGRLGAAVDVRVRRKDGTVFLADIASARVALPDGAYLAAFFRDVTAKRKAEEDLRALQAQLAQAQKMEGIGRLAGGIAHDFNNVLSVILTCAGFVQDGLDEGHRLREDVLEITRAADRAATLTRQLLAFGRKQMLQPVSLDVNETLAAMEKMLRRIIGEDVDLVQVLAPDLWSVRADPGQLEQVLMNLAVNARDAMPDGGKLTIETANVVLDEAYTARHAGATPGPHVMLAVTDSGVGMDEATRNRVFEPFFTTKGPGKGNGLGLSTVYGIVKQSGGSIYVYSEVGQGTTFKVYLPRDESPVASAARPAPEAAGSVRGETILLVEDDAATRDVARRILSGAGYEVLVAAGGAEGLQAAARHAGTIHLLLTDVVMPQMSGKVLAERMAQVRPGITVLYMSGYTDNAIVHHGVLDPGTLFVGKPFSQADLLAAVRAALDGAQA